MVRRIALAFLACLTTAALMSCTSDETTDQKTMEDVVKEVTPMKTKTTMEKTTDMAKKAAAAAKAKAAEAMAMAKNTMDTDDTIVCSLNSDERKIAVEKTDAGCSVQYEKNGATQEVANASNRLEYCGEVQENIQNNLTNAGFTCN